MSVLSKADTMNKPCVVLGVTGGIAAYKACEVLRLLQKQGCDVQVVMTKNACQFIAPLTFETLSNHPVAVDTFRRDTPWEVEHVSLAKKADLFLIVPATANILAKMAAGLADDMLSTTVLAAHCPVLVAPAMNTGMLQNPATQANIRLLQERGIRFVEPVEGRLACGDEGAGKLADVGEIAQAALAILNRRDDLTGIRIAVTAGPTRENIDPVRYISNQSSGKMGYALAEAAQRRGAEVTLLSGPVSLTPPAGVNIKSFMSTRDLLVCAEEAVSDQDIFIQAAAPADYRINQPSDHKIKKDESGTLDLHLVENPDVAATIGTLKKQDQVFIGFAAETDHLEQNAEKKLQKKNLDMIVANDVTQAGAGFNVDTNIVTLMTAEACEPLPLMSKIDVADVILDRALAILRQKRLKQMD